MIKWNDVYADCNKPEMEIGNETLGMVKKGLMEVEQDPEQKSLN